VLVEDGRIATVSRGSDALSADAHRIDGGGATLMPGMVECHAHITYQMLLIGSTAPVSAAAVETTLMTVHNALVCLITVHERVLGRCDQAGHRDEAARRNRSRPHLRAAAADCVDGGLLPGRSGRAADAADQR